MKQNLTVKRGNSTHNLTSIIPSSGQVSFAVQGNRVRLQSSTGKVNLRVDSGVEIPLSSTEGWVFPGDFERITLLDTSGATNTVVVIAGYGDFAGPLV